MFTAYRIWRGLEEGALRSPFVLSIVLFLLGFLGLAVSLFPYAVPPRLTIWQVSNTPDAQMFALVGYLVVMPLTYSIANGIGAGFISWVLIKLLSGRGREVSWLLYVVAAGFLLYFARGPLEALLGVG